MMECTRLKLFRWRHRLMTFKCAFLIWALVAAFVLAYAAIYIWMAENVEPFLIFELIDPAVSSEEGAFVQEIICPRGAHFCYRIEDYQLDNEYRRRLMVDTIKDGALSDAELINANGTAFTVKNARTWPINHRRLIFGYLNVAIAQGFITGALLFNHANAPKNSLIVGLGGGSLAMAMSTLTAKHNVTSVDIEPAMEYISAKWFGAQASEFHHIVIEDGVEFIRRNSRSSKFQFILIDACHTSYNKYAFSCPIAQIFANDMAQELRQILSPEGCLTINVYFSRASIKSTVMEAKRAELLAVYRRHFKNCYYAVYSFNFILTCTSALNAEMTEEHYEAAVGSLIENDELGVFQFRPEIIV